MEVKLIYPAEPASRHTGVLKDSIPVSTVSSKVDMHVTCYHTSGTNCLLELDSIRASTGLPGFMRQSRGDIKTKGIKLYRV